MNKENYALLRCISCRTALIVNGGGFEWMTA